MDKAAGEGGILMSLQNSGGGGDVRIRQNSGGGGDIGIRQNSCGGGDVGIRYKKKCVAPWRFQEGYRRSSSKVLNSNKEESSKTVKEKEEATQNVEPCMSLEEKEKEKASGGREDLNLKSNGDAQVKANPRKRLAPWRFQIGYVRSSSKTLGSRKNNFLEESFRFGPEGLVGSVRSMNLGAPSSSEEPLKSVETVSDSTKKESAPRRYPSRLRKSADRYTGATFRTDTTNSSKKNTHKTKVEHDRNSHAYQPAWECNGLLENAAARYKVKEILHEFRNILRKVFEEVESKLKEAEQGVRLDHTAFKLFSEKYALGDDRKYVGSVPGVEVGDEFHRRVELCIVGLHRQHLASIDFVNQGEKNVAISIVSSGRYSDVKGKSDMLIYPGCGMPNKDQKLDHRNLALKNSMETRTPVRVIYGFTYYQSNNSQEARAKQKKVPVYIYDGLYLVENYWRTKGKGDHYVFMFQLRRMAGQPKLDVAEVMKSKRSEACFNLYLGDVSQGKEKLPISAVNAIDNEYPMPFKYITKLIYPFQHQPPPPSGCDCIDGCSDSDKCACAVKNGGEIPFNHRGEIVEAKPLVYECGPSCKCPPSCHNRVSQHGIKYQLQIFKTESRGWGVRSVNKIPSGSFVCEYVGEVLEDEEAQKRRNDEYLFAIGNNYYDESLWEGLSTSIPALQKGASCETIEMGFAIDASAFGNVGRFINHSCSPNLYAQNLLYDHDDKSMPHVMFFTSEDIQPLQELTYDYNYTIDQVHDSDGNVKRKNCYCGSIECTGRLY